MILQICMENIDCNCSHGIGLHLTNIFWNCILGLNGLVLKFIIFLVQTGQARSWGPLGKWTCHPQSSPQPRTRQRAGSDQMQLHGYQRTSLCLSAGPTLRSAPLCPWSRLPAARQAPTSFLLPWKLTPYPQAWRKFILSLWHPEVEEGHLQIVMKNIKIKANLALNLRKFGVWGFSACSMKKSSL